MHRENPIAFFRTARTSLPIALMTLIITACTQPAPITPAFVDTLGLAELSQRIDDGAFRRVEGVIVSQNGQIVFEDYFGSHSADKPLDMRSVGKSLTALAIGIAIDEQHMTSVDQSVIPSFADRRPYQHDGPIKQAITVGDLLTMRSAFHCDDWRSSPGNEERMYRTRDWTEFVLNLPIDPQITGAEKRPNRFSYCTAGVFLLGQFLERETNERFDAFVADRIFTPLEIDDAIWRRSPGGEVQSGGQIQMSARDAERLGRLVLNEGRWEDVQIVPRTWINDMLTPRSIAGPGLGYAYLWWTTDLRVGRSDEQVDAAFMLGNGGNIVLIIPELSAVIVVQATSYNDPAAFGLSRILIERHILPVLADQCPYPSPCAIRHEFKQITRLALQLFAYRLKRIETDTTRFAGSQHGQVLFGQANLGRQLA